MCLTWPTASRSRTRPAVRAAAALTAAPQGQPGRHRPAHRRQPNLEGLRQTPHCRPRTRKQARQALTMLDAGELFSAPARRSPQPPPRQPCPPKPPVSSMPAKRKSTPNSCRSSSKRPSKSAAPSPARSSNRERPATWRCSQPSAAASTPSGQRPDGRPQATLGGCVEHGADVSTTGCASNCPSTPEPTRSSMTPTRPSPPGSTSFNAGAGTPRTSASRFLPIAERLRLRPLPRHPPGSHPRLPLLPRLPERSRRHRRDGFNHDHRAGCQLHRNNRHRHATGPITRPPGRTAADRTAVPRDLSLSSPGSRARPSRPWPRLTTSAPRLRPALPTCPPGPPCRSARSRNGPAADANIEEAPLPSKTWPRRRALPPALPDSIQTVERPSPISKRASSRSGHLQPSKLPLPVEAIDA